MNKLVVSALAISCWILMVSADRKKFTVQPFFNVKGKE
jgi:hypothetical protein